ncbi:hypothetical protein Dda_0845 [Drechslerella dactyloides]|uniref:F-box domain-containing protein n=1 Tax=Drechslerella dactyloides TaxID=74499 RepID=A0AAD6J5L8_DREDA|nr:hypothetical protein Dda_0845 [Drechslerella dactyloides]
MTSIFDLPTELLFDIFSGDNLTCADLGRCQQVCKTFRDIIQHCKIDYTFKVDVTAHSAWRLIRCLLINPQIGERFKSIKVTWHRRRPMKPKTWAAIWSWTKEEREQIEHLGSEWLTGDTIRAIWTGLNSEALLPFLLCFTPNLESLDLGEAFEGLIYPTFTAREGIRVIEASCGDGYKWSPKGNYDDGWAYYDAISAGTTPRREDVHPLWFHMNLNPKQWLPGLANITYFAHDYKDHQDPNGFYLGWPAQYLAKILLLPRLQTARVRHCATIEFRQHIPLFDTVNSLLTARRRSTVKRLELVDSCFRQEDYDALAKLTGSLERVEWSWVSETSRYYTSLASISEERVAKAFLRRNKRTLTPEQVFLVKGEPGSESEGENKEGEESDLGSDDDSYYYISDSSSDREDDDDDDIY